MRSAKRTYVSLCLALIGLTALAGFFHYIWVGPSEIDERDEAAARDMGRKPEKTS
ncbi:MAG: formate dehydrogenase N subunit beta transmembrane domain-containing protein [Steroidobacteraceae bacterium]